MNKRDEIRREINAMCDVIDALYAERIWLMETMCTMDKQSAEYRKRRAQLELAKHLIKVYEG